MVNRQAITAAGCLMAVAAGAAGYAAADADPAEVLKRVTAKVLAASKRLPNFTCVETVTRETVRPTAANLVRPCSVILEQRQHPTLDLVLRPYSTDRLRLDVTLTDHGEIFSWAGANRFSDASIDRLVREGPLGTGAFGGFLQAIFDGDAAVFTFARRLMADGRSLMEYAYQVPRAQSHYRVKVSGAWYETAYGGTVQVEPGTAEVVRLTVETEGWPPSSGTCMDTADLEYAMAQIGDSRIPLATKMRQRFITATGLEAENTTVFTGCREYKGESTVTFLAEPKAAPTGGVKRPRVENAAVAAGQRVVLMLNAPIDIDSAAAGDRFSGKLDEPLRVDKSRIVAPIGSLVEGRLLRVETFHNPPQVFVVLRPDTVYVKGTKVRLAVVRDRQSAMFENRTASKRRIQFYLPLPGEEQAGVFQFPGQHVVVRKGFQTAWRTVAPAEAGAGDPQ